MSKTWNLDDALKSEKKPDADVRGLDGNLIVDSNAAYHSAVALTDIARSLRTIALMLSNPPVIASGIDLGDFKIAPSAIQEVVRDVEREMREALGDANPRA